VLGQRVFGERENDDVKTLEFCYGVFEVIRGI
jgi:hypothetical protein